MRTNNPHIEYECVREGEEGGGRRRMLIHVIHNVD